RLAVPAGAGLADGRGGRRRGAARGLGWGAGADGQSLGRRRRGGGLPAPRLGGGGGGGPRPAPGRRRRAAGPAGRPVGGLVDRGGRGGDRPRRVGRAALLQVVRQGAWVTAACAAAGVSRTSYYRWRRGCATARAARGTRARGPLRPTYPTGKID